MISRKLYDIDQLENILSKTSSYIYGAGRVAKTVIKFAAQKQKLIDAILVSDKKDNCSKIMGLPVCEMTDDLCIEDKNLIVCVMENLHDEINEKITNYNINNVWFISDKLYEQIVFEIADYEIDSLYELNLLNRKVNELSDFAKDKLLWKNTMVWDNAWERNIIKNNWGNVTEEANFAEKYLKLIRGLDLESIETITRILNRQKIYLKSELIKIDIFTEKEKKELKLLEEDFNSLIIKLSDEMYMYKSYLLPCERFGSSVFFYKYGIDKIKNFEAIKGKTIIDVGAFVGDSALILSELSPKKIISFEAVPEHCELFNKTVYMNSLKNVEIVNYALGKETGTISMNLQGPCSTFADRKGIEFEGKIEVPIITLDQFVEEHNVQDIALIKVDIEGAEPDFLEGAKKTISKYKPILLLSIYHNAHDFFELKPMIEEWNLGYKFTIYKPTNGNITNETLLIAEVY